MDVCVRKDSWLWYWHSDMGELLDIGVLGVLGEGCTAVVEAACISFLLRRDIHT